MTSGPETDLDLTALQSVYDQHPDVVATEMATDTGIDDFSLSRWPEVDYQQLARFC